MKKIYLNFALVLVAGLFLFGCSDDNDAVEKVNVKDVNLSETRTVSEETMTPAEEDAAFQDLFV